MKMSTTPFWKKIYQTVSGYSHNITEEIVAEILKLSQTKLLEGLLSYKAYTRKGYDDWVSKVEANNCMKDFVFDLSQDLNLDAAVGYTVMCNYLTFEYYGKIKEFLQITKIGTTVHLKESIWNFYTAERMFLLKTWRHIFEFFDQDYEFAEQYKDFIKTIKMDVLQDNLIKQFEALLNENYDEKNPYIENWLCRNLREQSEILSILILSIYKKPLETSKLTQIIMLFIQNNFSTTPPMYELTKFSHNRELKELMYTEIGCYFVLLDNLWNQNTTDFWNSNATKEVDECLLGLHLNSGHTVVMLAWLLLKYKHLNDGNDADRILELLSGEPFVALESIISSDIFKYCSVGEVVLKAAHKVMDELCLMYADRKVFYEQKGVIEILAEFCKISDLASLCLSTRNGLDTLIVISIEAFPYDFLSFSKICESLLGQKNHYKQMIHLLNNIPSFLSDLTWTIPKDEISVLTKSQPAFSNSDLIVFPPNTTVRSFGVFGKVLLQYRGSYSYFIYLEYLVNLLINNGLSQRTFDKDLVEKVIAGYRVVIQGIKYCVDMDLKVIGLERIILKFNKLIIHLDGLLLNFELVKLYFDVQNAMMESRQGTFFDVCPDIVWKAFFPRLKGEYEINDATKLLFNHYMFEDTIFMKLFKEEEFQEDHMLLLTYLKILYNIIKVKFQHKNFQLSGVAYLFNYVFLQHQSWPYKDEDQKTQITLACMNICHYILQRDEEDLDEEEKKVFYLCQHAFLNNVYIIESFLRLFIKEKYHLIFLMERESNWVRGPSLNKLKCIRVQLALLLLIMNKKKLVGKCALDEKLSFVVKPVASYFTNSYSPVIAELSCRFLEKLAQDQYIPLLALLELDHYQVQTLFLERLRDPLEEETVKMAIIDLINTCVSNQNGMTAAFFNLKCFMYWDGAEEDVFTGDSVSDFMVDYLQNIKKSHEYFKNPLQLGILRLFYNLWFHHRENLIENIANLEDFWPVMADPFFCHYVQEVEIYTIILKIINLEIGTSVEKVDEKLTQTIEKFLKDKERLNEWIEFVLASSDSSTKNHLELLNAWMEFLILTKKFMKNSFDNELKVMLIDSCLRGLNIPEGGFNNIETIYLWGQLYLMLTTAWPIDENQQQNVFNKVVVFLHAANAYYKYLSPNVKEIILAIVNKAIIDLKSYFSSNNRSLITFLHSVGSLIDAEHEYLVSEVWRTEDGCEKISQLKPWLIIIFIGNSIIAFADTDEVAIWFHYQHFLQRVMDSVGNMLQHRATLPFAKLAVDFMIAYAESPLVRDYLKIDLFTFYYKVRPPPLTISVGEAILAGVPVHLKEWWLIFITLIKLNCILMEKLKESIFSTCFTFITEHDELLNEIVSLTRFTVDMTALTLVCEALKLVHLVMSLLPHWKVEHPRSYELITDGIKTTINACVLSMLGYKKINFYNVHGEHLSIMATAPNELLVSVLNKLTEIIYWGSNCLRKTKPNPIAHLHTQDLLEQVTHLVENDFSVPRFEPPIVSKLTYGSLLCLADYLCKTLNQLSPETRAIIPTSTRQVSLTDLHKDIKIKSLGKIFEYCTATYEKYIGFMVYLQRDDLHNEKLSSFLHYDISEFSGSSSAISQLDYHIVKNALESLMYFLACEIFYTIKQLNEEALFAYRRELSSEIQFFYEFVRKRTSEQYHVMAVTPKSTSSSTSIAQSETDIVKRYMVAKVNDGDTSDIADNNFVLVISQWLIKFCHLSN